MSSFFVFFLVATILSARRARKAKIAERVARKELFEQRILDREAQEKQRSRKRKKMTARSSRNQPIMKNMIEHLLSKLEPRKQQ
jgi:hypothetical protein